MNRSNQTQLNLAPNDLKLIKSINTISTEIDKYINRKPVIMYQETYDMYKKMVEPTIKKCDRKWVFNILDGNDEQEKIIYQNDNFVLLPDTSWNSNKSDDLNNSYNIEELYLLLIVKRKDIYSIRDLTAEHLPLLEDMMNVTEHIEKIYKIPACMLRTYFHYKPSTWHLHLHINNINSPKNYCYNIERCHTLSNVINNLKCDSNYYKKVDLQVTKCV